MISFVIYLIVGFTSAKAETACGFAQTVHAPYPIAEVEMISRVDSVGLWRGGDVVLNPWIEISPSAYLGVDKQGRVLNVIKLKDRNVGFLLSGDRNIKDLFFHAPGHLLAIDAKGELLQYKQSDWEKHSIREIIANSGLNFATTMCASGLALISYHWLSGVSLDSLEVVMSLGLAGVASLMAEGFRGAISFEKQNEMTDGFTPVHVKLEGFRHSRFIYAADGTITDYMIKGRKGEQSLNTLAKSALLATTVTTFDKTCAHDLLARGNPPKNYEPQF